LLVVVLPNLLLAFPSFAPAHFEPWVDREHDTLLPDGFKRTRIARGYSTDSRRRGTTIAGSATRSARRFGDWPRAGF
jgi:hypothetical protein